MPPTEVIDGISYIGLCDGHGKYRTGDQVAESHFDECRTESFEQVELPRWQAFVHV